MLKAPFLLVASSFTSWWKFLLALVYKFVSTSPCPFDRCVQGKPHLYTKEEKMCPKDGSDADEGY